MAGRAGRRGKDTVGYSILCMDPGHQIPPNNELIELLESKGIQLESKLNVNYDMCLNSLKQDQDQFGEMLKNSFFANESA
jgi:superfamily II RNA helicase